MHRKVYPVRSDDHQVELLVAVEVTRHWWHRDEMNMDELNFWCFP